MIPVQPEFGRSPEIVEGRLSVGLTSTGSALRFGKVALALFIATPLAATPNYAYTQLADPAKEAQAKELMASLRCIQCQGQSIADSDADMAATMRAEVRKRIDAGDTSDNIRQWMVERYGEWVSFEPAMHGAGLVLWIAPLLILGIALLVARGLFRKAKA